jgi:predicted O-methyltransferase YrrM
MLLQQTEVRMYQIEGCPVPVYQDEGELNRLVELVKELKPKRILEIGSLHGGTLWYWMHAAQGAEIVSVDSGVQHFDSRFAEIEHDRINLWPEWEKETGCTITQIRADSTSSVTIEEARKYAPFDFIFIDGGHDYNTAMSDWVNYWPMLRTGGLFAFHDIVYLSSGVPAVWRTVRNHGKWQEIIREHNPEGLWGIGVMWKE